MLCSQICSIISLVGPKLLYNTFCESILEVEESTSFTQCDFRKNSFVFSIKMQFDSIFSYDFVELVCKNYIVSIHSLPNEIIRILEEGIDTDVKRS